LSARSKARKRAIDLLFEAEQRGINARDLLAERLAKPVTRRR
jgi:N utilization substance protein B